MVINGYKRVWNNTLKKQVYVHRLVAAQSLGRAPLPGEVVHHLNGEKHDLRPENLLTLPSQATHMVVEHTGRKRPRGMAPLFELKQRAAGQPTTSSLKSRLWLRPDIRAPARCGQRTF